MIQKLKWTQLMSNVIGASCISPFHNSLASIDTLLNAKLPVSVTGGSGLADMEKYIVDHILVTDETESIWKDLPIYVSSYKAYDKRFIKLIFNKMREYIDFYYKILTDNGVARRLIYSKDYNNYGRTSSSENASLSKAGSDTTTYGEGSSVTSNADGQTSGNSRKIRSETPAYTGLYDSTAGEVTNTLFDQAIANYASSLDKDKSDSSYQDNGFTEARKDSSEEKIIDETHTSAKTGSNDVENQGSSETVVSGVSWEEQKKNLSLLFYNELKEFINSVPEMIYHHYAIDTVPFTELTVEYFKYLYALGDMLKNA